MCEIQGKIDELEREAALGRRAIRRSQAKQRRLLEALDKERAKEARTREQHLDKPNRLIADLLEIKSKMNGGVAP